MSTFFFILAIILAANLIAALLLVFSDAPKSAFPDNDGGMSFASAVAADYTDLPPLLTIEARDGQKLAYRQYVCAAPDAPTLILVHGSGWHGMQFHTMAKNLSLDGCAHIIVPDLRGHGVDPERRGDVDYIGQLEDDLSDIITSVRATRADAKIIIGGHSSGGGLAIRFAGGKHGALADGFVLMAPFLKHNASTGKPNSGGWAHPAVRRIIGLTILNRFQIRALNHLAVIRFAMPRAVIEGPFGHTATIDYSYRLNQSFAPRAHYQADIASITQEFLLLAGRADEAFHAEQFEKVMAPITSTGVYHLLDDVGHIDLISSPEAISTIKGWLGATDIKSTRS